MRLGHGLRHQEKSSKTTVNNSSHFRRMPFCSRDLESDAGAAPLEVAVPEWHLEAKKVHLVGRRLPYANEMDCALAMLGDRLLNRLLCVTRNECVFSANINRDKLTAVALFKFDAIALLVNAFALFCYRCWVVKIHCIGAHGTHTTNSSTCMTLGIIYLQLQ